MWWVVALASWAWAGTCALPAATGATWTRVDTSGRAVCALDDRGRLACMNTYGCVPHDVAHDVVDFIMEPTPCALDASGAVVCVDERGQPQPAMGPHAPPQGVYHAIFGAGDYACALRVVDGEPVCWGEGRLLERAPPLDSGWTAVWAGYDAACVTRPGATRCWPRDVALPVELTDVQFGDRVCGVDPAGALVCAGSGEDAEVVVEGPVAEFQVFGGIVCSSDADGHVTCPERTSPPPDVPLRDLTRLGGLMAGVDAEGGVRWWGAPTHLPFDRDQTDPLLRELAAIPPVDAVTFSGARVACARSAAHDAIVCWGEDGVTAPIAGRGPYGPPVFGNGGAVCALDREGVAQCAGEARFVGTPPAAPLEKLVALTWGFCGTERGTGALMCWGGNSVAAIYRGATLPPVVRDLAAGGRGVCVLDPDGRVSCSAWMGGEATAPGPFETLAVGDAYTCGLRDAGRLECWGEGAVAFADRDGVARVFGGGTGPCVVQDDGVTSCFRRASGTWREQPDLAGLVDHRAMRQGDAVCALLRDGAVLCRPGPGIGPRLAGSFTAIDVAEGSVLCGLDRAGEVQCATNGYNVADAARELGVVAAFAIAPGRACGVAQDGRAVRCAGRFVSVESVDPALGKPQGP